jgi:hypothetical protein
MVATKGFSIVPWLARVCFKMQAASTPGNSIADQKQGNKGEHRLPRNVKERERVRSADDIPKTLLTSKKPAQVDKTQKASHAEDAANREIPIDSVTTLPYDLYRDLVRAGRRAKARGQHEYHESPSGIGGRRKRHLRHMNSAPF